MPFEPNPDKVTLFSRQSCVQCNASKKKLGEELAKTLGVADVFDTYVDVVDMGSDVEALEFARGLGYMQAPVVYTASEHWSGYQPDKIVNAVAEVTA